MATSIAEKPWTDEPLALIPTPVFESKMHNLFTNGASHMCMVHNSLFRGYNSIYQQAPYIADADKLAFIGYCLTWYKFLKTHADNEDISLFPKTEELLKDNTIFEESHKEHSSFKPGLAEFHDYLTSLKSPSEFSGSKLLEIMATFQEPLDKHMRSEVATIAALSSHPGTPKEGSKEEKAAQQAFDTREGNNLIMSGMTDVLPFFLFNYDSGYEGGIWADWPPIPGLVRWTIMNVAQILHPWWKFASCDAQRQRRPLYAVPGPGNI